MFRQGLSPLKLNSVLFVVAEPYDSLSSAYRTFDKGSALILLILYLYVAFQAAAQLAPTAVNQPKFFIEYVGIKEGNRHKVKAKTTFSMMGYTNLDLGIVKLHFEIGAGKGNFEWT